MTFFNPMTISSTERLIVSFRCLSSCWKLTHGTPFTLEANQCAITLHASPPAPSMILKLVSRKVYKSILTSIVYCQLLNKILPCLPKGFGKSWVKPNKISTSEMIKVVLICTGLPKLVYILSLTDTSMAKLS